MDADQALARVLEPLYESALDPERLSDFSTALCAATGSHVGALMVHDAGHGRGRLELLVGIDPGQAALYEREYAADNLWMIRGQQQMRTGGIMDSDTVATRAEFKRTRYYNEYLRQSDIEQSAGLCAKADHEGVVVATVCRAGSLPPYTEQHLALMRQVAPHWANAYAIQRKLSHLQRQVDTLEAAMQATPLAMAMLDERLRVTGMNPAAEQLFRNADVVTLQQGQLEAAFDTAALRHALHEAILGQHIDGSTQHYAGKVLLRDASGRNRLAIAVHPLVGPRRAGDAAAILFLQAVGSSKPLEPTLRQLFGLTQAEAALARALYQCGDLAAAASACGVATSTAQTRLKVVFDKTGEHSQAALVRLLGVLSAVC